MSTSIHDQELDMHLDRVESEMTVQKVTEVPTVYFRFGEESPVVTWTGLYRPHRS